MKACVPAARGIGLGGGLLGAVVLNVGPGQVKAELVGAMSTKNLAQGLY
jgi:uncharacterized membrane protein